jgi:hypothetical protein
VLRNGGVAPCILDLGTGRKSVVSFTHRPLYTQGKRPWYQLDTLFSNTLSLKDQVPHPYKIRGKIIVFNIIIFKCSEKGRENERLRKVW